MSVFIESFAPPPRMLVFGAVDFTAALVRVAKVLGYRVTVCDAREVFATRRRFPDADEVVVDWPHRLLERVGPIARAARRHLRAHPRPQVRRARASSPRWTPTSATSAPWAAGGPTPSGSSACGPKASTTTVWPGSWRPSGSTSASRTPEETAIAICAEIIALRTGRVAPSLRDADGAIHR